MQAAPAGYDAVFTDPHAARDPRSPRPVFSLHSHDGQRELHITFPPWQCEDCRSAQCRDQAIAVSIIWRSVDPYPRHQYRLRQSLEILVRELPCQKVNWAGQHVAVFCGRRCAEAIINVLARRWDSPFADLAKSVLTLLEPHEATPTCLD